MKIVVKEETSESSPILDGIGACLIFLARIGLAHTGIDWVASLFCKNMCFRERSWPKTLEEVGQQKTFI